MKTKKREIDQWELWGGERAIQSIKERIALIRSRGVATHFHKGQILFYEGHFPSGFFMIERGNVKCSSHHAETKDLPLKDDNLLGLSALVADHPYQTTCEAEDEVDAIFFPKVVVIDCLRELGIIRE